ncbi:MAG TPA: DMT family transporter [Candidatus Woesebacteria bacterium]|nr:DMT family transporter [Candidatus Woesebacteria bacterium]
MLAIFALIIANVIWGAASPIFKYALTDMPPFTLAFIRFFFAGLIFLPFISRKIHHIKGKYLMHVIVGGIWGVSINVAFFFQGLNLVSSINAPIIGAMGPLVLYVLSLFILKEKPHPQIMKGILFALTGVLIIVFAPLLRSPITHASEYSITSQIMGNTFFILAMLGAALHVIHTKKVANKVDPITLTGIQFFVGAISFLPFMIAELQTWSFSSLTQSSWIGIIYGIFFSSALGYVSQNYAIKKLPAQKVGIFSYMMPVVAVIVAMPLLGEYPDIFFLFGTLFVVVGIFISEKNPSLHNIEKKLHKK